MKRQEHIISTYTAKVIYTDNSTNFNLKLINEIFLELYDLLRINVHWKWLRTHWSRYDFDFNENKTWFTFFGMKMLLRKTWFGDWDSVKRIKWFETSELLKDISCYFSLFIIKLMKLSHLFSCHISVVTS